LELKIVKLITIIILGLSSACQSFKAHSIIISVEFQHVLISESNSSSGSSIAIDENVLFFVVMHKSLLLIFEANINIIKKINFSIKT
jgi:hypothetical protein